MPFYNVDQLRQSAQGRWADILVSAGLPASVLDGRNHACPKCGGHDRFAAFSDLDQRGAVHCRHCFTRGSQIAPCDGIATIRWWTGGSFADALAMLAGALGVHSQTAALAPRSHARWASSIAAQVPTDLSPELIHQHTHFARQAYQRMQPTDRDRLARHLYVSPAALTSLRVGMTSDEQCATWPMRNESGQVIGVRISALPWTGAGNAKWSRRGSHSGLFIPRESDCGQRPLYVTEGASDTAAANSLGLWAIGRASCTTSTFFIDRYIAIHKPPRVTIIADNDAAGLNGAMRLAKSLRETMPSGMDSVNVIVPPQPSMDLRRWIAQGANQADICGATPVSQYRQSSQPMLNFESQPWNTAGQC
ncbi:primase-helicase zinc-binding domain-containing protein [Stieleria tagensis]|uniref:primase-helicase zinc-binding domain-containing protein n=1 Tax=Stieleria tagensis TaxID=2956795 RepID=UPI00209ADA38|nr:primase-helicase zinc-binding domain-containing protein [Stieleria tagensis]